MLRHLAGQARKMKENAFAGINSLDDWAAVRGDRHRDFARDLSLLNGADFRGGRVVERGDHDGDGYRMRRINFEILPDCWAAAVLFYPDPQPSAAAPAVLYVCGHSPLGAHHYQYNALMWARRGYVCLVLETIEQCDNPGEHHGYQMGWDSEWSAFGYSSAGGETFSSLRALDLLSADPAVDAERIGVTGISGGGALSLYVAAIDERIKAVSILCGISCQHDAIYRRRLFGHCDCFYPLNFAGRDLSEYAALIAPRPALFCFGDNDLLFHPQEARELGERTGRIYELYGRPERFRLLTHDCGHENHPVFYQATQELFDEYLAGEKRPLIEKDETAELSEAEIQPSDGTMPKPNYLDSLPRLLCLRGDPPLPKSADDWPAVQQQILGALPPRPASAVSAAQFQLDGLWGGKGTHVQSTHRGTCGELNQWLELIVPAAGTRRLVLSIANPGETCDVVRMHMTTHALDADAGLAALEPRVAAGDLPPIDERDFPAGGDRRSLRSRLMHAMAMVGESPVTMMVDDLHAAIDYIRQQAGLEAVDLCLHGRGEGAIAALLAAIGNPGVKGLVLERFPSSFADNVPVPGILQAFEVYEAIGLMAPRSVATVRPSHGNANWPRRVYDRIGRAERLLFTESLAAACQHAFSS